MTVVPLGTGLAELNNPQEPAGVQLKLRPTGSVVATTMDAVPPAGIDAGGGVVQVIVMPEVGFTVMAALVLIAVLATEVAVMVTLAGLAGAV